MGRGPGKIERCIAQEIEKDKQANHHGIEPALCLSNWNIAFELFRPQGPRFGWNDWKPSRSQLQSVTRSMHSFVRKHQQYALTGGKGRKHLFLYEPDNLRSATMAKLRVERRDHIPLMELNRYLKGH
jgi:hypothetical protein